MRAFWGIPVFLLGLVGSACLGSVGAVPEENGGAGPGGAGGNHVAGTGGSTPNPVPGCMGVAAVGPSPVRRLTRREYDNTVNVLLGDTTAPAKTSFVADDLVGGFESNINTSLVEQIATDYRNAAERLAERAVANLAVLVPCAPGGAASQASADSCARQFVASFGKRALRRPLTKVEEERYVRVYADARMRGTDFAGAIKVVVAAFLQSPSFLNQIERGEAAGSTGAKVVRLTPHELASRLSYFLRRSMPDDVLLAAADNGKLASVADIEREARRLLADPKSRPEIETFYQQWLKLRALEKLSKDTKVFPLYTSTIGADMRKETELFVSEVLWQGDAKLATLLTANFSFVNPALAKIYGLSDVTTGTFRKVALSPKERGGILTQPSFLASRAYSDATDPVHRGLFVREKMFCQVTASPPPELQALVVPPPPSVTQTTRQRYLAMLEDRRCGGCHVLLNPIGLAMENYDGIGRYRQQENGQDIDTSGELLGTPDSAGPFVGLIDLTARLSKSQAVRDCMAEHFFTFAFGRFPTPDETCAVQGLGTAFAATGGDLKEVLVLLVKTDAFRHRRLPASTEVCQ